MAETGSAMHHSPGMWGFKSKESTFTFHFIFVLYLHYDRTAICLIYPLTSETALRLTMRRIDSEVDGHWGNPLVGASNTIRFSLNLQTDLLKVCEFLSFAVQELSIFCWNRSRESETVTRVEKKQTHSQKFNKMPWIKKKHKNS